MIVVHPSQAAATRFASDADLFCDVGECSVAGVVEEADTIGEADGEIGVAIVIEVASSTAEADCCALEACGFRNISELPVSEIVEEMAAIRGIAAHEEEIGFAVVVVVEETGAVGRADRRCSWRGDNCRNELWHEMNWNGGRRILYGAARKFGEREAALIAVAGTERSGDMVGGHFLEFGEMVFGRFGIAAALVGASQPKFGGGMKRKNGESFLKCGDGLIVALKLGIQVADEIPGVGFVGNLRDVREGGDAFFRVAEIFVDEAEVVPSVGILRKFLRGGGESRPSGFEFLLREERDAEIDAGYFELWVGGERLFEEFLRVGGALLVHVSDAKSVEAIGFGGIDMRRGFLRSGRGLCLSGARMEKRCGDANDG